MSEPCSPLIEDPSNTFFLRSRDQTIIADGCFKRIHAPAKDGARLGGEFQSAIDAAMAEAKKAGIPNPIVVGAIPFDPSCASELYIPQSWRKQDDETTAKQIRQQQQGAKPVISDSKLLPDHDEFIKIVSEAVDEIRQGKLEKVVLSRLRIIATKQPTSSGNLLLTLIEQNPRGHNFHVPLSDGSRLIGSSPELLLGKRGTEFYSQPLAGSAGRSKDASQDKLIPETLLRSQKDRHEHKLVVDSMRSTLAPRSKELHVPTTPECISTPKLYHLATSIKGTLKNPEDSALSLACLLHPTPALSGFPHEAARELLTRLEPFDREFFGGIVGFCDSNGDGEWFITIRSGRILGKEIQLFAGAGVVGDSIPESEWNETGIKLSTMLHAFDIV